MYVEPSVVFWGMKPIDHNILSFWKYTTFYILFTNILLRAFVFVHYRDWPIVFCFSWIHSFGIRVILSSINELEALHPFQFFEELEVIGNITSLKFLLDSAVNSSGTGLLLVGSFLFLFITVSISLLVNDC